MIVKQTVVLLLAHHATARVIVSEVAPKGSSGVCQGQDWIELYNSGEEAVDLGQGYKLHDDKGVHAEDAFTFPLNTVIAANEYLLLCTKTELATEEEGIFMEDPLSPQFGIGGDDTISLVFQANYDALDEVQQAQEKSDVAASNSSSSAGNGTVTVNSNTDNITTSESRMALWEVVSSVGPLPPLESSVLATDITYAYDASIKDYNYTSTPTPEAANIITPPKSQAELIAELKERLTRQDELGAVFFNMDSNGKAADGAMDEVLELHVSMEEEDYQYTVQNNTYEMYRPFQTIQVTTIDKRQELLSLTSPGRIRPKGQSSLYLTTCFDSNTFPFQLDLDHWNASQSLFGVEKVYLRNHINDYSYMRDWSYNRMLARFGLPYLRTRTVRLFINDKLFGLYSLMEAPDQDYVFARNFPNYNPESHVLYKFKNIGTDCGEFTPEQIENATKVLEEQEMLDELPEYAFNRGEHNLPVPRYGFFNYQKCVDAYFHDVEVRDKQDVVLAYLRHDRNCAEMRVEEGLISREMGSEEWDRKMEAFVEDHLDVLDRCEPDCTNSRLADHVDMENWLKTFAFYAVTMNSDSPMVAGNNYYLVNTGVDDSKWSLLAYDFNFPQSVKCNNAVCDNRLVHWSIVRPTCEALEKNKVVGPLLTNATLQKQYLEYVEQFLEVYSDPELIQQMQEHAAEMDVYVREDIFSVFGAFFDNELSPDATHWNTGNFPLLPTMKARTEDVIEQLAAIEAGAFPRGPTVGVEGDNEAWETCADWRLPERNTTACELGCKYQGCHIDGWTVESFCDEGTGVCFHGDYDESCRDIPQDGRYDEMKDRQDGRKTFCRYAKGIPVKASECPAVGEVTASITSGESGVISSAVYGGRAILVNGISSAFVVVAALLVL